MTPLLAVAVQAADAVHKTGWTHTIEVGIAVGVLAVAGLLWIAAKAGTSITLNYLLVIFGGATGWAMGILLTPANTEEKTMFSEYGKALSAFFSGYVLAKLGPAWDKITWDTTFFTRALLFLGSFSVFLLLLFVVRYYT